MCIDKIIILIFYSIKGYVKIKLFGAVDIIARGTEHHLVSFGLI